MGRSVFDTETLNKGMAGKRKGKGKAKRTGKRTVRRIRGRGNYTVSANPGSASDNRVGIFARLDKALRRLPRGALAGAGERLGGRYGGNLGAKVGRLAGAGMSAISGYGNYTVAANSLSRVSTSMDMVPQFVKNEHSIRVKHREFIRDVIVPPNPQDFDLKAYVLNPANRELFPWLGQMARQYSQYRIHGMVFAFKTMSSDYAASGPLGTVMMATNYNALDREFASKVELENTEFAVSCKPSQSLMHAIECDPKVSGFDILYIRDPGYDTGETSDRRFYDYGKFQIATQGLPGITGNTMGELWVSYDIELIKPIIGGIYSTADTVVSNDDGTVRVGPASSAYRTKLPRIGLRYAAINPVVSTVYNVIGATTPTLNGATALLGPVLTVNNGIITFKQNGRFDVVVSGLAATTTTTRFLVSETSTATQSVIVTKVGSAYYNADEADDTPYPPSIYGPLRLPSIGLNTASPNGLTYTFAFRIEVGGIVDAGDSIVASVSEFTSSTSSLVTAWERSVDITWSALGVNEQTQAFVPLQKWVPPPP